MTGALDALIAERFREWEERVVREMFTRGRGWDMERAERLIAETHALAAEKGWPLLDAADWVWAFGCRGDVMRPKTGLRPLLQVDGF